MRSDWRWVRASRWMGVVGALLIGAHVTPTPLVAQPGRPMVGAAPDTTPVSPASPRASLEAFQRLAAAGDWTAAADYLAPAPDGAGSATQLARRLKIVLDQRLTFDVSAVSSAASGDTTDGDPLGDRLGVIAGVDGRETPVRLVRVGGPGTTRWVFSSATVGAVNGWYAALGVPWVRDRVSPTLLREGPLHVFLWQWIGLLIAIPVLFGVAWLVAGVARRVIVRVAGQTTTNWDDLLSAHVRGPFRLCIGALLSYPIFGLLELNARLTADLHDAARGAILLALFWALLRIVRQVQHQLEHAAWDAGYGAQARTLVPLVGNLVRVALAIVAVLVALAQFGYPVGTLLAGLGIGGIGVALAAQKTVEHLFGSVSLAADNAFRVGDWVRAGTTEGAVERIGLRSTSVRTNERTVVRIPNGRLADERIETFGERDRMMLKTEIDLPLETAADTIDAIRDALEATLRAHPSIWPESVRVHAVAFTDTAVRLKVLAWFQTTDWSEFLMIRHRMLLQFLRVVESHGTTFAFPSRRIYHVSAEPGTAPPVA